MLVKKTFKSIIYAINRRIQKRRKDTRTFITCCGNADGAGAQAHAVVSTILYAKLYGLQYVHTPFSCIEHKPALAENWELQWEHLFNLGYSEIDLQSQQVSYKKSIELKHPLLLWKKKNILYKVRNCHEATDVNVNALEGIQQVFKKKFNAGKKALLLKQSSEYWRIAVHMRRGDVSQFQNAERFTPSMQVREVLEVLLPVFREKKLLLKVELYSVGEEKDFEEFRNYPVCLHLNENEYDSFMSLATADVLIMAKSSFSYMAAFLSDAFVIYDKFWHPSLNSWTSLNEKPDSLRMKLQDFLTKRSTSKGSRCPNADKNLKQ